MKCKHKWEIMKGILIEEPLNPKDFYEMETRDYFNSRETRKKLITTKMIEGYEVRCKKCWAVKEIKKGEKP